MTPTSRRKFIQLGLISGSITILAFLFNSKRKCGLETFGLIKRADWGAVEPNHDAFGENGFFDDVSNPEGWFVYNEPLSQALNTIVIHHSALPLTDGPLEIQQKHMDLKGFADIGYHFLIDENGQLYEGRRINVRGAHTGGFNTGTIGICLLGNFEITQPTALQSDTLKKIIPCLAEQYDISHLAGHRDFQPDETVCPGQNLAHLLPELAQEFELIYGTGGYKGMPATS